MTNFMLHFGRIYKETFLKDEKTQIMQTNIWLRMSWVDIYLTWDPAEYGGIKEVRLPITSIWKPVCKNLLILKLLYILLNCKLMYIFGSIPLFDWINYYTILKCSTHKSIFIPSTGCSSLQFGGPKIRHTLASECHHQIQWIRHMDSAGNYSFLMPNWCKHNWMKNNINSGNLLKASKCFQNRSLHFHSMTKLA